MAEFSRLPGFLKIFLIIYLPLAVIMTVGFLQSLVSGNSSFLFVDYVGANFAIGIEVLAFVGLVYPVSIGFRWSTKTALVIGSILFGVALGYLGAVFVAPLVYSTLGGSRGSFDASVAYLERARDSYNLQLLQNYSFFYLLAAGLLASFGSYILRSKWNRTMVVGILLVTVAIVGAVGFFQVNAYNSANQGAANLETMEAANAAHGLRITCSSNGYNYSYWRKLPDTVWIEVYNPSNYPMIPAWHLTINYTKADVVVGARQAVILPAQQNTAYMWDWTLTPEMASAYARAYDKNYTITLSGTDTVYGAYGGYNFTWSYFYDSATNTATATPSFRPVNFGRLPNC